ncbi:MAG: pentapeptide repeat-containing protein [Spirochaetes bacterium]|nr:pentapeptide repeat-containing protein [Spirochaetota bacterium]
MLEKISDTFMLYPSIRKISLCAILSLLLLSPDCARYSRRVLLTQKLAGANLSGYDFYNLRLPQINLTKSRLVRTNFSFAVLTDAVMVNADLRGADLSAADLSGADLRGANLRNALLHNAILKRANLIDSYCYGADLSGADLRDAIFVSKSDTSTDESMRNSDNRSPLFAHLRNADMSGAAVSVKMKDFISKQNVRNFEKIIWVK